MIFTAEVLMKRTYFGIGPLKMYGVYVPVDSIRFDTEYVIFRGYKVYKPNL